uniref:Mos1 transposase HTH domain-containing protein n=1 Tax=Eptatretus burgeri TaxID=7764 RepID=A0A8C4Q567_EPTBU
MSRRTMSREQRANLKFLTKLGKTPSESFTMLQQVYREDTMSRTHAFEWHKRFKEGREEVEDDPRSGRPSMSRTVDNIEHVKQMVHADHQLTVWMIAEELSINKETVWSIITENLEMRKVCGKMVPKLLSEDQKQQRVTVCQDIMESINIRHLIASSFCDGFHWDSHPHFPRNGWQNVAPPWYMLLREPPSWNLIQEWSWPWMV